MSIFRRLPQIAILLTLLIVLPAAARPGSIEGKWRLDIKQSELLPGEAPLAELVMNITEDDDKGFRWTVTVTTRTGDGGSVSFIGAIDGKPHPVQGRPGSTSAFSWTPDGKLKQVSESPGGVSVESCSFSPDRNTMSCDARQTDAAGRAAAYTEVFRRG